MSCIGNMIFRVPIVSTLAKTHETLYHTARCQGDEAKTALAQTVREVAYDGMMVTGLILLVACAKINANGLTGPLQILKRPIAILNKGWDSLVTKFGTVHVWSPGGSGTLQVGFVEPSFFKSTFNLAMSKIVDSLNHVTESRLLIISNAVLLFTFSMITLGCSCFGSREIGRAEFDAARDEVSRLEGRCRPRAPNHTNEARHQYLRYAKLRIAQLKAHLDV